MSRGFFQPYTLFTLGFHSQCRLKPICSRGSQLKTFRRVGDFAYCGIFLKFFCSISRGDCKGGSTSGLCEPLTLRPKVRLSRGELLLSGPASCRAMSLDIGLATAKPRGIKRGGESCTLYPKLLKKTTFKKFGCL